MPGPFREASHQLQVKDDPEQQPDNQGSHRLERAPAVMSKIHREKRAEMQLFFNVALSSLAFCTWGLTKEEILSAELPVARMAAVEEGTS
jgi:hypothetical protein